MTIIVMVVVINHQSSIINHQPATINHQSWIIIIIIIIIGISISISSTTTTVIITVILIFVKTILIVCIDHQRRGPFQWGAGCWMRLCSTYPWVEAATYIYGITRCVSMCISASAYWLTRLLIHSDNSWFRTMKSCPNFIPSRNCLKKNVWELGINPWSPDLGRCNILSS